MVSLGKWFWVYSFTNQVGSSPIALFHSLNITPVSEFFDIQVT